MSGRLQAYAGVARAPFLLLPVTLIIAGSGVAFYENGFDLWRAFLALVGLVGLHIAVNSFNEVSDFRRGIDLETERTPFSGGSGTLPAGTLPPGAAVWVGFIGAAAGFCVGVYFLRLIGWPLVPLLVLGAVATLAYSDVLARLYLGEIFAGLGLGALPVLGTVLVQTETLTPAAIAASLPAFFMTFNLLLLNEFPDEKADRKGGRRNLLILCGRRGTAWLYVAFALLTALSLLLAVLLKVLPILALLAVLPTFLLLKVFQWALTDVDSPPEIPALGANVIWNLATNLLLGVALFLAS